MVVLTRFSAPTEGIKHEQPTTNLFVNGRDVGVGTLYIAESELSWRKNSTGEGISLPYTQISLHAVSRDVANFGHECLFLMTVLELEGEITLDDEDSDEEGGEERLSDGTELRFVPADKGALDVMFTAMNYCQSLHPDPEGFMQSEDEEEDDDFHDAHEGGDFHNGSDSGYAEGNLVPDGSSAVNGFYAGGDDDDEGHDSAMEVDHGQFEDAED